jgi:uncharacterized protein YndB with AHSA1/START domain
MNAPIVKAEMLIRKPPAEVFNAIIDPAVTTKFWFTKSSGKLEPGKRVRWDWEMVWRRHRCRCEGDRSQQTHPDRVGFVCWTHAG